MPCHLIYRHGTGVSAGCVCTYYGWDMVAAAVARTLVSPASRLVSTLFPALEHRYLSASPVYQPRFDRVSLDISDNSLQLQIICDPMILGFRLPKLPPCSAQK